MLVAAACTPPLVEDATRGDVPVPGGALEVVEELTVKGRAPKTGYEREVFGSGWLDPEGVGCDTRNLMLQRDLDDVVLRDNSECVVETGTLKDPFSAEVIKFQRGQETSMEVQVDHLVALSDAWQKGAQDWDEDKRILFANDPLNLLAVTGELNQEKGDADAATWLPPNKGFRCSYVARLVAVKAHYGLWVTQAEQDAMRRVLTSCPGEELPPGGFALDGSLPVGGGVFYRNCAHVWDELGRPIRDSEPGYGRHLDRDGDGMGCEHEPGTRD